MVLTLVCFEDIFAHLSLALLFVTDQPFNLGGVIPPTQRFYLGVWRQQFSPQGSPVLLLVGVGPTQCQGPLVQTLLELFYKAFGPLKEKGLDQWRPSLKALVITLTLQQYSPSPASGLQSQESHKNRRNGLQKQTSYKNQLECLQCLTFTFKKIKHYKTSKPHIKQADTTAVGPKISRLVLPRSVGIYCLFIVLGTIWILFCKHIGEIRDLISYNNLMRVCF